MIFRKYAIVRRLYSQSTKPSFVTTPIFYVNAAPHIGHLYSAVITDTIHRFNSLTTGRNDGLFSTGTDEHGLKIQQAAVKYGIPVSKYCDNISTEYRNLFKNFGINHTRFIRTTDLDHKRAVGHFWEKLKSKGDIYSTKYAGWYCVPDETFLTESQLKEDDNGTKFSIESGHTVEWTEEENYLFRLSKYQDDILNWINSVNTSIKPAKFKKILLDYMQEPLPDISISRPVSRVSWGIPIPGDKSQSVYVWLDALVNYLTCAGYPDEKFSRFWPPTTQVLGKDILKFHGIYWPAFLIAAGLEPPRELLVHSHWTVDDQKMSKSKFNVVDPNERALLYTHEGMRYFLLREGVAHSDGNYSETKIFRILNSELADTLGNLLSRACAKSLNPRQIWPQIHPEAYNELISIDTTQNLLALLNQLPEKCLLQYTAHNFYKVVDNVIQTLHAANNFFETTKPWELKNKSGRENEKLETIIALTMETLRQCGIILQPIIPQMSGKLLRKLCEKEDERLWCNLILRMNQKEKDLDHTEDAVLFRRIILPKENVEKQIKKKV